ncbi:MAG: hypothetical protein IH851_05010 [Armatimonadetes bacterium]|nr:hypothetical protein [Armatimonadota bacterium]
MNQDKKKYIVFGILGVVLLGVGAWQIVGPGGSKEAPKPDKNLQATNDRPIAGQTQPGNRDQPDGTDIWVAARERRDPFQPSRLPEDPSASPPRVVSSPTDTRPGPGPPPGPINQGIDTGGLLPWDPIPVDPGPDLNAFNYTLVGIVEGPSPMAVFRDATGAQKLVRLKGFLQPESQVVAIRDGNVTVVHRGEEITLTVGG